MHEGRPVNALKWVPLKNFILLLEENVPDQIYPSRMAAWSIQTGSKKIIERLMEVEEGINCCSNNHKTEPDASKYLQNRCCFRENLGSGVQVLF
jgi:hypothetical protein